MSFIPERLDEPVCDAYKHAIAFNEKLQVLSTKGELIKGLYAVGNASGDLYAVDYPINVPGCSHGRCLTWGYLAGKAIAGKWEGDNLV